LSGSVRVENVDRSWTVTKIVAIVGCIWALMMSLRTQRLVVTG
jgi:uncharacterized membrane protein YqjE